MYGMVCKTKVEDEANEKRQRRKNDLRDQKVVSLSVCGTARLLTMWRVFRVKNLKPHNSTCDSLSLAVQMRWDEMRLFVVLASSFIALTYTSIASPAQRSLSIRVRICHFFSSLLVCDSENCNWDVQAILLCFNFFPKAIYNVECDWRVHHSSLKREKNLIQFVTLT